MAMLATGCVYQGKGAADVFLTHRETADALAKSLKSTARSGCNPQRMALPD